MRCPWLYTAAGLLLCIATVSAEVIVEDTFTGGENRTSIAGTVGKKYEDNAAPSGKNLPGGKWIKVAGYDWLDPFIPASWDEGLKDYLHLGEDLTGIAISLEGHNKGALHIMADVNHTSSNSEGGVALGFYSELTKPNTRGGELTNFTGIMVRENGAEPATLQVYEAGQPVGDPVAVGAFDESKFYKFEYDVDTATGKIANVKFDGKDIAGLQASKFTAAATAYAAFVQSGGQNGRGAMDNFQVSRP